MPRHLNDDTHTAWVKCEKFNHTYHVGAMAEFHPETRAGLPHSRRATLGPAFVLGGQPAVWLSGWGTPIHLDNVVVVAP